jgi:hypothetical protein
MNGPGNPLARALNLGVLAGAWLIVPGDGRAEWWREWRGELWQARQDHACDGEVTWQSERVLLSFCLGAYQDAICVRNLHKRTRSAHRVRFGAAWQCLLILAVFLSGSYLFYRTLPGVRAEQSLSQLSARSGLVLIQDLNRDDSMPTISSGQYRAWKGQKQQFFDGFAFYRITGEKVSWHHQQGSDRFGVARASSNLFTLLGMPFQFADAHDDVGDDVPYVVLSERAWRSAFGADPDVEGKLLEFGSHRVRIAGVIPEGAWGLPGKADVWLVETDRKAVPVGPGYVVAHLSESGRSMMQSGSAHITSYSPHRTPDDLVGISIGRDHPSTRQVFLLALLLALLALPALTSVSPSEYSVSFHEVSLLRQVLRWSFLAAKFGMVLAAVYMAAIDLGYGFTSLSTNQAISMQLIASFFGCLFGMCWILSDQKRRCPICLERVAHPARVGQFSRMFFAWSGTELMCTSGHTLLHVPTLPTSWFSSQRWMFLDSSWKFLFADPVQE